MDALGLKIERLSQLIRGFEGSGPQAGKAWDKKLDTGRIGRKNALFPKVEK